MWLVILMTRLIFHKKKLSKMVKSGSFIFDPLETNDQFEIVSSSDYISKKL